MTDEQCLGFADLFNKSELEKLHTKQLLKKYYRIDGGSGTPFPYSCYPECDEECAKCVMNQKSNIELVKEILAIREHVPNKKESKQLRKERIKRGK